jgi:hypothetical protein
VAGDRPGDHAERQQRPERRRCRYQQQDRGDQLGDPGADPPDRLEAECREDVHRLGCGGELEEQRLQQDARHHQLGDPAHGLGTG